DRGAGATTLRSAISGLRHTLEPQSGARASSRYILTRPGGYAWNAASGAWVDAEELLALTDSSTQLRTGDRRLAVEQDRNGGAASTLARADRLEQAIALYRGDYLGDELDAPWATIAREALRERFLAALHELAELRLADQAHEAAIELARRGLEHDRLREPLYRILMQAQARLGDVAGALQSYERCRRALDDELGSAPSAQTRALHAAILRGEELVSRGGEGAKGRGGDRSPLAPSPPGSFAPSPFVGRADELAALSGWI